MTWKQLFEYGYLRFMQYQIEVPIKSRKMLDIAVEEVMMTEKERKYVFSLMKNENITNQPTSNRIG